MLHFYIMFFYNSTVEFQLMYVGTRGTSGTGTRKRGTVPSRPSPIPDLEFGQLLTLIHFWIKILSFSHE